MTEFQKRGIPKQHGLIERSQLLKQLLPILDYRVTLLSSPPGCGKTMLAAQFATDVECHVIWHNISKYQQDMRVMISHLLQSLSEFLPDVQTLNNFIEQPAEMIAHGLAQLLDEHTSDPFILILDDWQRFSAHHPANQWLKTFISFMPDNCHLILLSQTIPPLDLVTMVAKREILALQQEDLYFTEAEVYLLAAKLQSNVSSEALKLVWEKMRGWAAGTILTLQPNSQGLLKQLTGDNSPSDVLFQSIAQDMLKQQAPDIQHFLKWTSTVESFDSTICGDDVLRLADWEKSLAEVINNNLFVQEEGLGYKYHGLFRRFLQTHFRLNQPEAYAEAHRRIATWYERQGLTDRAIDHYLSANAIAQARDLLELIAHSYFIQGRIESLRIFSEALSDFDIDTPHFDYVRSRIALDYDRDVKQALFYAQRALEGFRRSQQTQWSYRTHYQTANIAFFQGDYQKAEAICNQIIDVTQDYSELQGLILARRGMCRYYLGNLQTAINDFEPAFAILEQVGGWLEQSYALQDMEIVYRALNNKRDADFCLQRLIHLRRLLGNREELALALNNLGYQYYMDGYYAQARDAFEEGLDSIRLLETGRSRYFLYASLGDLERDCGYYEKAREYYQQALSLVGDNEPYMRCETLNHLASLYRWQGRSEAAMTCAQEAMEIAKTHQILEAYSQAQLESMHIKLQPYNLRTVTQEAKNHAGNSQSVEAMVLQLRLAHFYKDKDRIRDILAGMTGQYARGDDLSFFFAELANNQNLTELRQRILLHNDTLKRHLQNLLAESDSNSRRIIIPISPPTSSLEVYSLGAEIIRQDGKRVANSVWKSKIAREMFFYFVFHRSSRRNDMCLIFWKDKSSESAIDLFHQMIARIRQTVGGQTILHDERTDRYTLNPEIYIWSDALRLDTLVEEAQKLGTSNLRTLSIWNQATQLLTGDFLPSFDRQWITERRSKYQELTLEAWMQLGQCYMTQNNYHAALQSFQTAAQHDDLHESAYRGQMTAWSHLGERSKITYTYNLLRTKLREELGTNPSPQTDKLYIDLLY